MNPPDHIIFREETDQQKAASQIEVINNSDQAVLFKVTLKVMALSIGQNNVAQELHRPTESRNGLCSKFYTD